MFFGIILILTFSICAYADIPTYVYCGQIRRTRNTGAAEGAILVVLKNAKNGEMHERRISLDEKSPKDNRIVLIPTRFETDEQLAIPRTTMTQLLEAKANGQFVCISFSFTEAAMQSGFPHEIGVGETIEDAVNSLQGNTKF